MTLAAAEKRDDELSRELERLEQELLDARFEAAQKALAAEFGQVPGA